MENKEKLEKKSYKQMTTAVKKKKKKAALERYVWEQKEGERGSNSLSPGVEKDGI